MEIVRLGLARLVELIGPGHRIPKEAVQAPRPRHARRGAVHDLAGRDHGEPADAGRVNLGAELPRYATRRQERGASHRLRYNDEPIDHDHEPVVVTLVDKLERLRVRVRMAPESTARTVAVWIVELPHDPRVPHAWVRVLWHRRRDGRP